MRNPKKRNIFCQIGTQGNKTYFLVYPVIPVISLFIRGFGNLHSNFEPTISMNIFIFYHVFFYKVQAIFFVKHDLILS